MELTWVALAGSLMMGLGAACMFIFAVKKNYFHDLEDAKYQVFWSDLEEAEGDSGEAKTGDRQRCPRGAKGAPWDSEASHLRRRNGRSSEGK